MEAGVEQVMSFPCAKHPVHIHPVEALLRPLRPYDLTSSPVLAAAFPLLLSPPEHTGLLASLPPPFRAFATAVPQDASVTLPFLQVSAQCHL